MKEVIQPLSEAEEAELRKVVEGMTPGPWRVRQRPPSSVMPGLAVLLNHSGEEFTGELWADDADTIVALRNAAPRLLATIDSVRTVAEVAQGILRGFDDSRFAEVGFSFASEADELRAALAKVRGEKC